MDNITSALKTGELAIPGSNHFVGSLQFLWFLCVSIIWANYKHLFIFIKIFFLLPFIFHVFLSFFLPFPCLSLSVSLSLWIVLSPASIHPSYKVLHF